MKSNMSRRCAVNNKKAVLSGNTVSHSNRKTRRRFLPNLQKITYYSEALKKQVKLRLSTNSIRTIEHNDGIDGFLASASSRQLGAELAKLQRAFKKVVAANQA